MTNKIHTLYGFILLLCLGCSGEIGSYEESVPSPSSEFSLELKVQMPTYQKPQTRAYEELDLSVLVFEKTEQGNAQFVARHQALLTQVESDDEYGNETNRTYTFRLTMTASDKPCRLHFVANYDNWDSFPKSYEIYGADEGELIPQLISQETETFWTVKDYPALDESLFSTSSPIQLVSNQAMISVCLFPNVAQEYTLEAIYLDKAPKRGYVARFSFGQELGAPTILYPLESPQPEPDQNYPQCWLPFRGLHIEEYENASLDKALETEELNYIEVKLFEKYNLVDKNKLSVILRMRKKASNQILFYKVDLISSSTQELLDIVGNIEYQVTVMSVKADGYPSLEEALAQPASNSIFTSVEFLQYPSISNGSYQLAIDNTASLLTENNPIYTTGIHLTSLEDEQEYPKEIKVRLLGGYSSQNNEGQNEHIKWSYADGLFRVESLQDLSQETQFRKYNFLVSTSKGLSKQITVSLQQAFTLKLASNVSAIDPIPFDYLDKRVPQTGDEQRYTLSLDLPEAWSEENPTGLPEYIFPLHFVMKCDNAYPSSIKIYIGPNGYQSRPFDAYRIDIVDRIPNYIYTLTYDQYMKQGYYSNNDRNLLDKADKPVLTYQTYDKNRIILYFTRIEIKNNGSVEISNPFFKNITLSLKG